jgi:mono/diheme cytochrome c family protein
VIAPRILAAFGMLALVATLAGCEKTARNMYDQPRDKPLAASPLGPDGRSAREPVDGTVARAAGTSADTSSGRLGALTAEPAFALPLPTIVAAQAPDAGGAPHGGHSLVPGTPSSAVVPRREWTAAFVARGRERYDIFCAPCHSIAGDGDGMVARRGFPHPPSFHIPRLVGASDEHYYAVISDGYGDMYPYATRIAPADRRAIVAYIRALQLAFAAPVAALPADARAKLGAAR